MNILLDSNIIMSMLIKPNGTTDELSGKIISVHTLLISGATIDELTKHHTRLLVASKLLETDFNKLKFLIFSHLSIIPMEIIPLKILLEAYKLIADVDENDIAFVATTIFVDGILWTGDKKLYEALQQSDVVQCFNSQDIQNFIKNK